LKVILEGRGGEDTSEYTIKLAEDAGEVLKADTLKDVEPK
jgi:hypothetical protein